MDTAFQADAFQNDAFQIEETPVVTDHGGRGFGAPPRRRRRRVAQTQPDPIQDPEDWVVLIL